jgi:hypothetical protein
MLACSSITRRAERTRPPFTIHLSSQKCGCCGMLSQGTGGGRGALSLFHGIRFKDRPVHICLLIRGTNSRSGRVARIKTPVPVGNRTSAVRQVVSHFAYVNNICDGTGWSRGNTVELCSGGARFESRPGHRIS